MIPRRHVVLTVTMLCLLLPPLAAQPPREPKDGKLVIPLTLSPTAAPKPASKYFLLPELKDAIPGNRVQMFMRCFAEQDLFFGREESEKRDKWNVMPLAELPDHLKDYGGRLVEVDMRDAARMTHVDWQILYFIRRDGFKTLLPEVQKMRSIASVLKTRLRGAIQAGNHQDVIATTRTFLALAKSFEHHPTLIGGLVGTAVGSQVCDPLEEYCQQPGAPNLFWSFADLPAHVVDFRRCWEGERIFTTLGLDGLDTDPESPPDETILKKLSSANQMLDFERPAKNLTMIERWMQDPNLPRLARAKNETIVKESREHLITIGGYDAKLVAGWSPLHVVVLDEVLRFEIARDDCFKWVNLPFWQAREGIRESQKVSIENNRLAALLLPAVEKIPQAQARLDQRFAYLRVIEAIRLHAYENGGKLPESLGAIKLPLPVDPVSGKAFQYSVQGEVATLTGENPDPRTPAANRLYEIRLRK